MRPELLVLFALTTVTVSNAVNTTGWTDAQLMTNVKQTNTDGDAGDPCGDGCNKCLRGYSDCVNGKCQCKLKKKLAQGDGDFFCYRKNKRYGEIRNDPLITSFDGNTYDLAIPCRYLLMHTRSELRIRKEVHGHCDCIVHGWNKKYKGKMYPAGVDIACDIVVDGDPDKHQASIRIEGEARDNEYHFNEWGSSVYAPDGPWNDGPQNLKVYKNGATVATMETVYKTENNFAEVEIRECGIQVGIRPFDTSLGKDQCQQNGVSFSINCAADPIFLAQTRMVVSAGDAGHGDIAFKDHIIDGLSAMQSFLFRAMTTDIVQNQPDAAEECSTVQQVADRCDTRMKRVNALGRCIWLLKEPRFIKCADPSENANGLMKLFRRCFEVACMPDGTVEESCWGYVNDVKATGCTHINGISDLDHVLSSNYCANFWQN